MENPEMFQQRIDLESLKESIGKVKTEIGKVIVGQTKLIDLLLIALLADGHVLIEGVPGIAKTLSVKLISRAVSTGFSRIQFTPDLMPSDILGTSVFNLSKSSFEFNRGPIFSNFILVDEINRAPAKTQSALFEVMEERQVSIDGNTYIMEKPFIVFATQNPLEHEGTYRLPEAQLDRFMFKINIGYPDVADEITILRKSHERRGKPESDEIEAVLDPAILIQHQNLVKQVHIEENLQKYIAELVNRTRNNPSLYLGGSPRASLYLMNASKAYAAMQGRDFVTPDDIRFLLNPVLNHRLQLTPEKEMEGFSTNDVINEIAKSIEVPR